MTKWEMYSYILSMLLIAWTLASLKGEISYQEDRIIQLEAQNEEFDRKLKMRLTDPENGLMLTQPPVARGKIY